MKKILFMILLVLVILGFFEGCSKDGTVQLNIQTAKRTIQ